MQKIIVNPLSKLRNHCDDIWQKWLDDRPISSLAHILLEICMGVKLRLRQNLIQSRFSYKIVNKWHFFSFSVKPLGCYSLNWLIWQHGSNYS